MAIFANGFTCQSNVLCPSFTLGIPRIYGICLTFCENYDILVSMKLGIHIRQKETKNMQDFKMPFSEKTASIGISFDVPNKKETIIIGSPVDVKRYYTTGILSENADLRARKLGTLVDEMNELTQDADGDRM